jgi:hypothetical protein
VGGRVKIRSPKVKLTKIKGMCRQRYNERGGILGDYQMRLEGTVLKLVLPAFVWLATAANATPTVQGFAEQRAGHDVSPARRKLLQRVS